MCYERRTYDNKLKEISNCQQFTKIAIDTDSLILKVEKKINNTLIERKKKQELKSDKNESKLWAIGAQLAMLYGLT